MAIPAPDWGSSSVWYQIAGRMDYAAEGIRGAGDWLGRIPIIGGSIGIYFGNAAWFIERGADLFRTVGNIQYEIQSFARNLQVYGGVRDLIEQLWTQFNQIRTDPVGWLRSRLYELSNDLWSIWYDATGWVRNKVRDADVDLRAIINTGGQWVRDKVYQYFPNLPSFNTDPFGYIKNVVRNYMPELSWLFVDPQQWLRDRLGWLLGVPQWFFDDFGAYVTQRILDVLETQFDRHRTQIYRMGEAFLRRLWDGF